MAYAQVLFTRSRLFVLAVTLPAFAFPAHAAPPTTPKISSETRQQIIHAFSEDLVYIRTNFPMGRTGLKLKDGSLTPSGPELQQLMAIWGPAAKPGDRARISDITIKDDHIRFEINGGPIKRQKWYQHIQISAGGNTSAVQPSDPSANARGSFVALYFDKYVPDLTGPELKQLLRPVFDFDAKTPLEAYLQTVTPKVSDAIKNHRVLVGMNHEMVIYAKGRPPKKIRETAHAGEIKPETAPDQDEEKDKDKDVEFEEWIYGNPPEDVDFVRFVGDEVVRVETMKVTGEKIIRAEKEVDTGPPKPPASSVASNPASSHNSSPAPTLRRPGEEMPDPDPANPSSIPPMAPVPPPSGPGSDPGGPFSVSQRSLP